MALALRKTETRLHQMKISPLESLSQKMRSSSKLVEDSNKSIDIYSPDVKLKETDKAKKITRFVIGKEIRFKPTKSILVVGATGTGKTTFVNAIFNFLYNVQETDDFRFKIVSQADEGVESAKSKTKTVNIYTLMGTKLDFDLNVIDTPGYGDTEGLMADKRTTSHIKDLFEGKEIKGVDALDAVCLVVKSTDTRLTATQKHDFNSVLQLFGKDIANNINIIATFADAKEPPVKLSLQEANIQFKEFFKFNNSCIFEGPKTDEEEQMIQSYFWKITQAKYKLFFDTLQKMHPVSLVLSAQVLRKRKDLELLVLHLHEEVHKGLEHLESMRQEAVMLEKYKIQIEANKEFTYEVEEHHKVRKDIDGKGTYTTTCLKCNFTCHNNCAYKNDSDKKKCIAMDPNGNCKYCPSKCEWTQHSNCPFIYVIETQKVTKTHEDLKKQYGDALSKKNNQEQMLNNLGEAFGETQFDVYETILEIRKSLAELQEIAHQPNYLTDKDYLDTLILAEKEEKKPGWLNRVKHLEAEKEFVDAYSPDFRPYVKYENDQVYNEYGKKGTALVVAAKVAKQIFYKAVLQKKKTWGNYLKNAIKGWDKNQEIN